MAIQFRPLWKKVRIRLDTTQENLFGKEKAEKSVIYIPEDVDKNRNGFFSATVIDFDPLAGIDAKSGIRYHHFKVGQRILVNKGHVQHVFFEGEIIDLINDIFILAVEHDPDEPEVAAHEPGKVGYLESELPSTIHQIEYPEELD